MQKKIHDMDTLIKITSIRKRMKKRADLPNHNRIYNFFMGVPGVLKQKEIKEIKEIVEKDFKAMIEFLESAEPAK